MSSIERLKSAIRPVATMLDEPEPGLSTWHLLFRDNAVKLRDLLIEFYPLETGTTALPPMPSTRIDELAGRLVEELDKSPKFHDTEPMAMAAMALSRSIVTYLDEREQLAKGGM